MGKPILMKITGDLAVSKWNSPSVTCYYYYLLLLLLFTINGINPVKNVQLKFHKGIRNIFEIISLRSKATDAIYDRY